MGKHGMERIGLDLKVVNLSNEWRVVWANFVGSVRKRQTDHVVEIIKENFNLGFIVIMSRRRSRSVGVKSMRNLFARCFL